jgi:hypothetical protein
LCAEAGDLLVGDAGDDHVPAQAATHSEAATPPFMS